MYFITSPGKFIEKPYIRNNRTAFPMMQNLWGFVSNNVYAISTSFVTETYVNAKS